MRAILIVSCLASACSPPPYVIVKVEDPHGIATDAASLAYGRDRTELQSFAMKGDFPIEFILYSEEEKKVAVWVEAWADDDTVLGRGHVEVKLDASGAGTATVVLGYVCDAARAGSERCALETDTAGRDYQGVCRAANTCVQTECGDGIVDPTTVPPEECDDGNEVNEDDCLNTCELNICGDGYANPPSQMCDDGDTIDNGEGGCLADCSGVQTCGDYATEGTEVCDDGNRVSEGEGHCTGDCTAIQTCGNGVPEGTETCDDGDGIDSDRCPDGDGACQDAVCGDGFTWNTDQGSEECDDGNGDNTDACPDGVGGTCRDAFCGDGHVRDGLEVCDDGVADSADCDYDDGVSSHACTPATCGDGYLNTEAGETCDEGNSDTASCNYAGGTGDYACTPTLCGDTYQNTAVEECDEGTADTGTCNYDSGNGVHACTDRSCGDNYVNAAVETCDVGDADPGDGCDASCTIESGWHCHTLLTDCVLVVDETSCSSMFMPDYTPCEVDTTSTSGDRWYDICITGTCRSPGCGDTSCNPPGQYFPLAPESPSDYTRTGTTEPVVRDNVTGLMWQGEEAATQYTWTDAVTYCDTLDWGGYADWHLPSYHELLSVVDLASQSIKDQHLRLDQTAFPNPSGERLWTIDTYASDATRAWFVNLSPTWDPIGIVDQHAKSGSLDVRCVRLDSLLVPRTNGMRFQPNGAMGEEYAVDRVTGTWWLSCVSSFEPGCPHTIGDPPSQQQETTSWSTASSACTSITWALSNDWHLPSVKELASVFDTQTGGPHMDLMDMELPGKTPWTSLEWNDAAGGGPTYYMTVDLGSTHPGGISPIDAQFSNAWRCVR